MADYHYLIPAQQQGEEKNLECTIICDSVEEAEDGFVDAKERLMDVNNWDKYSGIQELQFSLSDNHGKAMRRHARRHDHIRITENGIAGHDWVAIEAIEYDDYPDVDMETFGMRLHPCIDPVDKRAGDAAYSLTDSASSTFVIQRWGKKLKATYHGRNDSGHLTVVEGRDSLSWLGLTELQWANLISGIAEPGMVKR